MRLKALLTLTIILAAFFLVSCVKEDQPPVEQPNDNTGQPVEDVPVETGENCRTVTEKYVAQVPYNRTEYYYVKEGVGREYCEETTYTDYSIKVSSLGKTCDVKLSNTGNLSGEFTLKAKFITTSAGGGPESEPMTKEVYAGDVVTYHFVYGGDSDVSSCKHDVISTPVLKTCHYSFYQDVRKSRLVTEYKNETRARERVVCD